MIKDKIRKFDKTLWEYCYCNKFLVIFIEISLLIFFIYLPVKKFNTSIDITNFYIKGIIVFLFTYFHLTSKMYLKKQSIIQKLKYCPIKENDIFNIRFKDLIKYTITILIFCIIMNCISCELYYSQITENSILYTALMVFIFVFLPGFLYLILEKLKHKKFSRCKTNAILVGIILFMFVCKTSSYFFEKFFNCEVYALGLVTVITNQEEYFNKENGIYSWANAEKFMPDIEDLPKYKKEFHSYTIDDMGIFWAEGLTLVVEYDEETYMKEKAKLSEHYDFLKNKKMFWGEGEDDRSLYGKEIALDKSPENSYVIPEARFSINSYDFKVVKEYNGMKSDFPSQFGIIGTSDEKHSIAYLYFYDFELDSIGDKDDEHPMQDFVESYFKYDF